MREHILYWENIFYIKSIPKHDRNTRGHVKKVTAAERQCKDNGGRHLCVRVCVCVCVRARARERVSE